MSTYQARHAILDVEDSPERRLLMRGGVATAAATVAVGAGAFVPADAYTATWRRGDRGSGIKRMQERLRAKGYWHSGSDGIYGQTTEQAVMAVQKVYGLKRDGIAGPQTRAKIDTMGRKVPRSSSGTVIEIELRRQLMIFVVNGQTKWVFNTSTGKAGWRTPPGRFTIFRQIDGMRYAPLGKLWRPKYFNGGIALHGSTSIPGYPASHGCTRLSNSAINYIWSAGLAPIGRRVWVY